MAAPKRKALVLFSGGQDSTVCVAWALSRFDVVETVGFDYGQRHRVELDCRERVLDHLRGGFANWAGRLGDDHVLDARVLRDLGETAMTHIAEITMTEAGLPNTFVPGRNLLFLVLATALAYRRAINDIVGGMCETDYSGYPDCRREALDAQVRALFLGMEWPLKLHTPLMECDKTATWELGQALGGDAFTEIIVKETHTCYIGTRDKLHSWGHGCGICPACGLRKRGWEGWKKGPP
ncbi:MAG: 7-cyano-7-deazaguanine synthase QueC [Pseudomonadota bacterium]